MSNCQNGACAAFVPSKTYTRERISSFLRESSHVMFSVWSEREIYRETSARFDFLSMRPPSKRMPGQMRGRLQRRYYFLKSKRETEFILMRPVRPMDPRTV